jgi:hypothetical protein
MKKKEDIEKAFRKDLQEFLDMYGAELTLEYDEWNDAVMNVTIEPKHHEETGKVTEEYCDFNI